MLSLCLIIQFRLRGTPLGFCLRVIVNEKPLNLETFSVLSVIYYKSMHIGFKFQIYYDVMPSIFSRLCGKKNNVRPFLGKWNKMKVTNRMFLFLTINPKKLFFHLRSI